MPALRSTAARRAGPRAESAATMTTVAARAALADIVNRAAFGKERIVLTRRGKPLVAVVPIEDVDAIEAMEDARDIAVARRRLARWEKEGRPGVSLEELALRNGLKP